MQGLLGPVQEQGRKGVDRGVHVAEVPLIGGELAAGVEVVPAEHQLHLLLGEVGVHDRDRQRVEGEIPGRVPGVLPLVRHRDDVVVDHVEPLAVPERAAPVVEGVGAVLLQPRVGVEVIILLRPEHAGDGLAHHAGGIRGGRGRGHGAVELVRLPQPRGQGLVEALPEGRVFPRAARGPVREAQPHRRRPAGFHIQPIVRRGFGADPFGVYGVQATLDHAVVDAVLQIRTRIRVIETQAGVVGFVLGEEQRRIAFAVQPVRPQRGVRCRDRAGAGRALDLLERRLRGGAGDPWRPVVAEPEGRQHVQLGRLRPPVGRGDLDQDVLGAGLGVFHEDVEVAVLPEDARIEQLVFHLLARAPPVRLHQVDVGVGRLGILVEVLHVGVGRRAVEVEVVLLDVFAVVGFAVGEPEEALLEDGVPAVPQREGEAEPLLLVGDAPEAVLAPAIGPGAGVVVREEVPRVAVFAVVLAYRPPLPFAEVRPPLLPGSPLLPSLLESGIFRSHTAPAFHFTRPVLRETETRRGCR